MLDVRWIGVRWIDLMCGRVDVNRGKSSTVHHPEKPSPITKREDPRSFALGQHQSILQKNFDLLPEADAS